MQILATLSGTFFYFFVLCTAQVVLFLAQDIKPWYTTDESYLLNQT